MLYEVITIDIEPDWVYLSKNNDGLPLNQYFIENPQMILGKIVEGNKLYGNKAEIDTMCIPFENSDLNEQLKIAINNLSVNFKRTKQQLNHNKSDNIISKVVLPADPNVKNFSFRNNFV